MAARPPNDSGSNKDTFAAEGGINLLPFSCTSVTAYRAVGSKTVATPCDVAGTNKQKATVVLPGSLTTITLSEGATIVSCPTGTGLACIGDAVEASIDGDTTSDVVKWTIVYNVAGVSYNANKLTVYHYNDAGNLTPAGGYLAQEQRLQERQLDQLRLGQQDGRHPVRSPSRPPATARRRLLG